MDSLHVVNILSYKCMLHGDTGYGKFTQAVNTFPYKCMLKEETGYRK